MFRSIPQLILALALLSTWAACESSYHEETALFEEAERRYARGDYDGASTLYRDFLRLHPLSPMADIAQQRIAAVEREIDAVMGRRGAPAPVYLAPSIGAGAAPAEPPGFEPVTAPEFPTFGR